ncbi:MAG: hypothetical protein WDW38_002531 [Sanguina aurantia]
MYFNVPGRPRSLADCVPGSTANAARVSTETSKLAARLALTGRYRACGAAGSPAHSWEPAAAAATAPWLGKLGEFRRMLPDPMVLRATLGMLGDIVSTHNAPGSCTTLARLVRQLLAAQAPNAAPAAVTDALDGSSASTGGGRALNQLITAEVFALLHRLTQQSFGSWQLEAACREGRSRNMQRAARAALGRASAWEAASAQAATDATDLVGSSDFPYLITGHWDARWEDGERGGARESAEGCTAMLLQLRLMLRAGPFHVICAGAAHMAAFLRLAKWSELYLELLPSATHVTSVTEAPQGPRRAQAVSLGSPVSGLPQPPGRAPTASAWSSASAGCPDRGCGKAVVRPAGRMEFDATHETQAVDSQQVVGTPGIRLGLMCSPGEAGSGCSAACDGVPNAPPTSALDAGFVARVTALCGAPHGRAQLRNPTPPLQPVRRNTTTAAGSHTTLREPS